MGAKTLLQTKCTNYSELTRKQSCVLLYTHTCYSLRHRVEDSATIWYLQFGDIIIQPLSPIQLPTKGIAKYQQQNIIKYSTVVGGGGSGNWVTSGCMAQFNEVCC